MTYYVGQPVLSAMSDDNTYVQETGPNQGEPVVRGIVTKVYEGDSFKVWWEGCDHPLYCIEGDVMPVWECEDAG